MKGKWGMDFRDFITMNEALLAKTAWRILHNPSDLSVQVLKSMYFPKGDFIDAKKGYKASWCWSSILSGRDFLKKNLLWDLGDGTSINIWSDPWVPNVKFPSKPLNCNDYIVKEGRISDLIVAGQWNLNLIRHHLPQNILDQISQISIPHISLPDKLVWTQRLMAFIR